MLPSLAKRQSSESRSLLCHAGAKVGIRLAEKQSTVASLRIPITIQSSRNSESIFVAEPSRWGHLQQEECLLVSSY